MNTPQKWIDAIDPWVSGTKEDRDYSAREILSALASIGALRQPGEGKGDWVMVPREPTSDMIDTFCGNGISQHVRTTIGIFDFCERYRAMLQAAPTPPAHAHEYNERTGTWDRTPAVQPTNEADPCAACMNAMDEAPLKRDYYCKTKGCRFFGKLVTVAVQP